MGLQGAARQGRHLCLLLAAMLALCLLGCTTCDAVRQVLAGSADTDAAALLQFKAALEDPTGVLATWRRSALPQLSAKRDPCAAVAKWRNITCSPASGRVVSLDLAYAPLNGHISPSLSRLDALTHLRLYALSLSGPLPSALSRLTALRVLNLANNTLSGGVARGTIGALTRLANLELQHNSLQGSIPEQLSACASLSYLDLSGNRFFGTIPAVPGIGSLPRLATLFLHKNRLSGQLSPAVLAGGQLVNLQLNDNMLTGPIPANICHLAPMLAVLSLDNNSFSGSIPEGIGRDCRNLIVLSLSRNKFSGGIPSSLCSGPKGAQPFLVFLAGNSLSGGIPAGLGGCSMLMGLDLSSNRLSGGIPSGIFASFKYLTELQLSNNSFSGQLPGDLGSLTSLIRLHLEFNNFTGSIPENITRLSSLEFLHVEGNSLEGQLPKNIGKLTALKEFGVSFNGLSGALPVGLGRLKKLADLDLEYNRFTGIIPPSLAGCRSLQRIRAGGNFLSGQLPSTLSALNQTLAELILPGNRMSGSLPQMLARLSRLLDLDLEGNQFSGSLPSFVLPGMAALTRLALSHNRLSGALSGEAPPPFANLQVLLLAGNEFSGSIPASLGQLTGLSEIQLQENMFSGSIPDSLEKLGLLQSLNLSSNSLSGFIPPTLLALPGLSSLDLSHNNLSGKISSSPSAPSFPPSSFSNNPFLCGPPLSPCAPAPSSPPFGPTDVPPGADQQPAGQAGVSVAVVASVAAASVAVAVAVTLCLAWYCVRKGRAGDSGLVSDKGKELQDEEVGSQRRGNGGDEEGQPSPKWDSQENRSMVSPWPFEGTKFALLRNADLWTSGRFSKGSSSRGVISRSSSSFDDGRTRSTESTCSCGSSLCCSSGWAPIQVFDERLLLAMPEGGHLTYDHIVMGTEGFADRYRIGAGGFGSVYKLVIGGPSGLVLAIKRLTPTAAAAFKQEGVQQQQPLQQQSPQQQAQALLQPPKQQPRQAQQHQGEREFLAEMQTLSRIRHRNLVPLLGAFVGEGQAGTCCCSRGPRDPQAWQMKSPRPLVPAEGMSSASLRSTASTCDAAVTVPAADSSSNADKAVGGGSSSSDNEGGFDKTIVSESSNSSDRSSGGGCFDGTGSSECKDESNLGHDGLNGSGDVDGREGHVPKQAPNASFSCEKLQDIEEDKNQQQEQQHCSELKQESKQSELQLLKEAENRYLLQQQHAKHEQQPPLLPPATPSHQAPQHQCLRAGANEHLLIYEFLPNGSLEEWLHPKPKRDGKLAALSPHKPLTPTGRRLGLLSRSGRPMSRTSTPKSSDLMAQSSPRVEQRPGEADQAAFNDIAVRLRVALGAARGLKYLHHDLVPPVVHRDIKPSNILLDSGMDARVADFGLARQLDGGGRGKNGTREEGLGLGAMSKTHVSTRHVAGTIGYLAPEYSDFGRVTTRSDVFSFGVVLLQLITGRKPTDAEVAEDGGLPGWVASRLQPASTLSHQVPSLEDSDEEQQQQEQQQLQQQRQGQGEQGGQQPHDLKETLRGVVDERLWPCLDRDVVNAGLISGRKPDGGAECLPAKNLREDGRGPQQGIGADLGVCIEGSQSQLCRSSDLLHALLRVGLMCTARTPSERPTMAEVMHILENVHAFAEGLASAWMQNST